MDSPTSHRWAPIEDLPENWRDFIDPQVTSLVRAWHERRDNLKDHQVFLDFLIRLRREWAIETGYIERLYYISEGATRTLIEKGLDAALLSHGDTDQEPQSVIAKIQDQLHALEGLTQFLATGQPLTKTYLKQLHQVLTAHQDTYAAYDTLGQPVEPKLPRGQWKKLPNDVRGADNFRFEFCPPEHVESEMDRLLAMHAEHETLGVPADIEAAWIHHRFSLIHPFTDGNGRIARCLATLMLLKVEWLPLVVTREVRSDYISALRHADQGDLRSFVMFVAGLQQQSLREALSMSESTLKQSATVREILSNVGNILENRKRLRKEDHRRAFETAQLLQGVCRDRLAILSKEVAQTVTAIDNSYSVKLRDSFSGDPKPAFHHLEVVECARQQNYFANLSLYHAWIELVIVAGWDAEILFSFHGMGRDELGVLACSAMLFHRSRSSAVSLQLGDVHSLGNAPFSFDYNEGFSQVQPRFETWMEHRIVQALTLWGELF